MESVLSVEKALGCVWAVIYDMGELQRCAGARTLLHFCHIPENVFDVCTVSETARLIICRFILKEDEYTVFLYVPGI